MYNKEKKRCDTCHTAFYIYKYRLNGNIDSVILQGQGEPYILCLCVLGPKDDNNKQYH